MAFCKKCGAQLEDGAQFCAKCGATQEAAQAPAAAPQAAAPVADNGPWKVFAILGLVFGIIGLVLFWFGLVGIIIAAVGLVFSILGKKSTSKGGMATAGLVLSIIGLALGLTIYIACCSNSQGSIIYRSVFVLSNISVDNMYCVVCTINIEYHITCDGFS